MIKEHSTGLQDRIPTYANSRPRKIMSPNNRPIPPDSVSRLERSVHNNGRVSTTDAKIEIMAGPDATSVRGVTKPQMAIIRKTSNTFD